MIQITPVQNTQKKKELLDSFSACDSTWLVGDLRSKFEVQKLLLERHGFLEEDTVLRASELWTKWAFRLAPEFRVVSSDYMRSYLAEFLSQQKFDFARSPGASTTLMTYVGQLLPVLASEGHSERMNEWFLSQESRFLRWRHWYEASKLAWAHLEEEKMITGVWCSGLVMSHWASGPSWGRKLYCDLGGQMSVLEAEILKAYSEQEEVVMMKPEGGWLGRFEQTLVGYSVAENKAFTTGSADSAAYPIPQNFENFQLERHPTSLSEVKSVCSRVREILDSGVAADKIIVAAPDIEAYWPVLSRYFEVEGIPTDKLVMQRLSAFSSVEAWLAKLRIKVGKLSSHDLERAVFDGTEKEKRMGYEKFKRLFHLIYDEQDLARVEGIEKVYRQSNSVGKVMNFSEFLAFAISWWPEGYRLDELAVVIKKLLSDVSGRQTLSAENWLSFLENLISKEEIRAKEKSSSGVIVVNADEVEWIQASHVFFMGFDSQSLNEYTDTGLTFSDVASLSESLGFYLDRTDHKKKELQAIWNLFVRDSSVTLSFSATDLSGSPLAPNVYWLVLAYEQKRDVEEFSKTMSTRLDELQVASEHQLRDATELSDEVLANISEQMKLDMGDLEPKPFAMDVDWSLSASQLENYSKCPFLFTSAKLFGLSDLPDVDLDIDHLTKGQYFHQLFYDLTEEPMRFDFSDDELLEIIHGLPSRTKHPVASAKIWEQQKPRFLNVAKRFLSHERSLREQFPKLKVGARELEVQLYWNQQNKAFSASEGIPFRGFIDRVDQAGDLITACVVDYKSSDTYQKGYRGWLDAGEFQLALYTLALESGLTELGDTSVIGAFYYSVKTMKREKGFRVAERVGELYAENKRNRTQLSADEKQSLLAGIRDEIYNVVEKMKAGLFQPNPRDEKDCDSCLWRKQCRAPHLN